MRPSLSHIYMELPICWGYMSDWYFESERESEFYNEWLRVKSDFFIFLFLSAIYLLFALLVSKFSLDFGSNTKINLCAAKGRPQEWLANDL